MIKDYFRTEYNMKEWQLLKDFDECQIISELKHGKGTDRKVPFVTQNVTVIVVPLPAVLSRLIEPPWKATACLTIESPRPVPPVSLE